MLPSRESRLGVNSSLREVCLFLQTRQIRHADADHYWPGVEFYLGENVVRYVSRHDRQQERASDPGLPPARFIAPDIWLDRTIGNLRGLGEPSGARWLIRFHKQKDSPFNTFFAAQRAAATGGDLVRIGDFDLLRRDSADATGKTSGMGEAHPSTP